MKLIFLDFDGVLNSEAFYVKRNADAYNTIYVPKDYPFSEFCPEAIENLNSLIEQTGANIVVSSTWRIGKTTEQLQSMLEKVGFKGCVIGKTPMMRKASIFRGNEIHRWIADSTELIGKNSHEFYSYVILDDDSDMLYWQRNNFILAGPVCRAYKRHCLSGFQNSEQIKICGSLKLNI